MHVVRRYGRGLRVCRSTTISWVVQPPGEPQIRTPAMTGRDPAAPSDRRKNPARKKTDRRKPGPALEEAAGRRKESGRDSKADSYGEGDDE